MSQPLRIVTAFHLPFYTPIWVAERLGAFRDEGFDVTISAPPPGASPDALERGDADVALSGVMRSFVLADAPEPRSMIAIAEVNSRDGFFILSRQPVERFAWTDLAGRRLALFSLAPTPWMCLQGVLRRHGVEPSAVKTIADLGVAEGIAALRSGEVDYLQTSQPMAEELMDQGEAHLAAAQAAAVGHVPYSSLIVTARFRDERPETCAAAVRSVTRALRWMTGQPSDTVADLVANEFPEVPVGRLRKVIGRYLAAGTWADGPLQQREPFDRLGRYLLDGGLIRTAAPYEALVDDSFAESAVAS